MDLGAFCDASAEGDPPKFEVGCLTEWLTDSNWLTLSGCLNEWLIEGRID